MEPTMMKLEDDCSNCANHEQGNFNRPPCDSCLDSTSTLGSPRYPFWKAKVVKDDINNPAHYTKGGIEAIDYMQAKLSPEAFRGYLRGCALKYLSRMGDKDDIKKDVSKAQWYVNKLVSTL